MSLRHALKAAYNVTDEKGVSEQKKLIDHIVGVSKSARSLRDLLKLLHYLDSESIEAITAMEEFVDTLTPIIMEFIPANKKKALIEAIKETVEESVEKLTEQEARQRRLAPAGSAAAVRDR